MKKFHAVFFTDLTSKTWHMKSLGPYRLASELRSHGYDVLVVDYFSKFFLDTKKFFYFIKKIISEKTLFVAYSGTFFTKQQTSKNVESHERWLGHAGCGDKWPVSTQKIKALNFLIKRMNSNCQIFYGGAKSHPITADLTNSGIDFVIHGFADKLIVDLAETLSKKKTIENFQSECGVKVLYGDNKNIFDFKNSSTYFHHSDFVVPDEILPLETSRGCMFKCKFCDFPLIGRKKNDKEYIKKNNVLINEIRENFEKYSVKKYTIVDDTFNESTEKLMAIHESLRANALQIEFSCYIRLDLLARNPEQIVLLKKMGCTSVFLGIETLNEKAAKAIGKSAIVQSIKETLKKINDEWGDDVRVFGSFIAGLPYENKDTINEWMKWVYDNKNLIHSYKLNLLGLGQSKHSSELASMPEKYGYVFIDANDRNTWVNNLGMSHKEAEFLIHYWMEKSWNTDRLYIAGWEALGLQNIGYDLGFLRRVPVNKLPFDDFADRYMWWFEKYKKFLFDYCELQCI